MTRGVVCLVLVACAPPPPVAPKPLTAAEILRETAETYAHAKSYSDHGSQLTAITGPQSSSEKRTFDTAFERGGRFRFEYRDDGNAARAFVIWSDGAQTLMSWYLKPGIERADRLGLAIAAATGVSGGIAHTVPVLLVPSIGGRSIKDLDQPTRDTDEVIEGHRCFRISGSQHGAIVTVWIDTTSHAIRQLRRQTRLTVPGRGVFDADEITAYEPALDTTVDASQLQPPAPQSAAPPESQPAWLGVMFDGHSGTTRIQSVVAGGPADHAGLRPGDVITNIDNQPVAKAAEVVMHVRNEKPGAKLHLTLSRAGAEIPLDVTLEKRPDLDELQGRFVGHPAPDFALASLSGPASAKLADLKGHVVIVDFWATWCGPCAMAVPHLIALAHKYKDLRIVGISDEDEADIRQYVADKKIDYTIARDADDAVAGHYLVTALPTLVIIDKAGVVRALHVGAGDFDAIEAEVQQYLK